jgi:hypothetical protein
MIKIELNATTYGEKATNKSFDFAVVNPTLKEDPKQEYKARFFNIVQQAYPQLTVIGLENDKNSPVYNRTGVQHVRPGSIIEVSATRNYNIDWHGTLVDAQMNGVFPMYDLKNDWNKVLNALDRFAKNNYPIAYKLTTRKREFVDAEYDTSANYCFEALGYDPIYITDAFVKIGTNIYSLVNKSIKAKKYINASQYRYVVDTLSKLNIIVVE